MLNTCHVAVFAICGVAEFLSVPKRHVFIVFKFGTAVSLVVSLLHFCLANSEHLKIFCAVSGVIGRHGC
jgi:hypothetical protein